MSALSPNVSMITSKLRYSKRPSNLLITVFSIVLIQSVQSGFSARKTGRDEGSPDEMNIVNSDGVGSQQQIEVLNENDAGETGGSSSFKTLKKSLGSAESLASVSTRASDWSRQNSPDAEPSPRRSTKDLLPHETHIENEKSSSSEGETNGETQSSPQKEPRRPSLNFAEEINRRASEAYQRSQLESAARRVPRIGQEGLTVEKLLELEKRKDIKDIFKRITEMDTQMFVFEDFLSDGEDGEEFLEKTNIEAQKQKRLKFYGESLRRIEDVKNEVLRWAFTGKKDVNLLTDQDLVDMLRDAAVNEKKKAEVSRLGQKKIIMPSTFIGECLKGLLVCGGK